MKAIILLIGLLMTTNYSDSSDSQVILQEVLNIEEFKEYISKSPRFISSQRNQILMLHHEKIDKTASFNINQTPIKIIDSKTMEINEKIFFIEIEEFEIKKRKAKLSLNYQNARLYFEENKKIKLTAELKKVENEWTLEAHELTEISISD